MIRPTLRLTLTLWYVGILALILSLFGWVLYASVAASLRRYVNAVLISQADTVANAILAFRDASQAAVPAGPGNWIGAPQADVAGDIDVGRLPDLVARWSQETGVLTGARALRVFDSQGNVLAASRSFDDLHLTFESNPVAQAQQGITAFNMLQLPDERVLVITRPALRKGRTLYIVQAAGSLRQSDASLERLRLWLLWLIPSTLVVTSAVGWFLASKAMDPVGQMTQQARLIGAEQLDRRIDVPRTGDELEQLAVTFNDMLARLEGAFHRLRQFSAAASHELRTPLTVMRGELEVTLRKPRTAEEYQRVIRTHLDMVAEITDTVEELLTLARGEAVKGALERQPVELGALAKQVGGLLQSIAKAKGVDLALDVPAPVWVSGEHRLLERLLSNLIDNAIKHTPSPGRVTVRAERRDTFARLSVEDTGRGISAEEIPHLFDRFFSRRMGDEGGRSTGLGLGLCRWIAEAHQGRIEVSSTPGSGSTFSVWLPAIARV